MNQETMGYIINWNSLSTIELVSKIDRRGLFVREKVGVGKTVLSFSSRKEAEKAIKKDVNLSSAGKEDYRIVRLVKYVA